MIAERHQRLKAMPAVRVSAVRSGRVVWSDVLAFLTFLGLLGCAAAGPSALREPAARAARAFVVVAHGSAAELTGAGERGSERSSLLVSHRAAQRSGLVAMRRPWHGRLPGADAGDDTSLHASRAERLGDVAHTAREHVDRRAQTHLPSGEPSPYDATAPPLAIRRDG